MCISPRKPKRGLRTADERGAFDVLAFSTVHAFMVLCVCADDNGAVRSTERAKRRTVNADHLRGRKPVVRPWKGSEQTRTWADKSVSRPERGRTRTCLRTVARRLASPVIRLARLARLAQWIRGHAAGLRSELAGRALAVR